MLNKHMQVIKRNGNTEPVSFDKVTKRLRLLCGGLEDIDPILVAQKVCGQIYDNVHTHELDELAAQICIAMSTENPKFGILASRIIISNNHKNTSPSFSETMTMLYTNSDVLGKHSPLLAEDVYQVIMKNKEKLNNVIDYKRDYNFDYFAYKTLERAYLFKVNDVVVERIQHMFMRVSIGIHCNDIAKAIESYNYMSQKYFTQATPTLYHSGTPRPQLSSCFLLGSGDSITEMYSTIADCAKISKWAGGIGVHISNIRSKGTHIRGTNGKSDGIIPMLRVFNETAVHVNQGGGKRPGSFAIYLEPHHPDVMQFLDLKKNHGNEAERARDLFLALWVSDLFMERVDADVEWSLLDPDECPGLNDVYGDEYKELYERYESEGRARKVVKARDVWKKALDSQMETGTPYISYKDHVNRKSNQKNYGIIRSSNLCVAPDTKILTSNGYETIKELEDQEVNVWNGEQFSKTIVRKTGENQKLLKITLSNGMELKCTEYHKFYVQTKYGRKNYEKMEAKDLKEGMKLIKYNLPCIKSGNEEFKYAYTHGFWCGDGTYNRKNKEIYQCPYKAREGGKYCGYHLNQKTNIKLDNMDESRCQGICNEPRKNLSLYAEKKKLVNNLDIFSSTFVEDKIGRYNCILPNDMREKFEVPMNDDYKTKLEWFAGLCDADGTIAKNGTNESLQLCSIELDFLRKILLMLQTIGIDSKIRISKEEGYSMLPDENRKLKKYETKTAYRLLITSNELQKMLDLGFKTHRLHVNINKNIQRDAKHFIKVEKIEDVNDLSDTYCFTEPIKNMGMFNGILTGNCAEILLYSDKDEYSVCNLASICLPMFVENNNKYNYEKLEQVVRIAITNLNKIVDRNFYPVHQTEYSNKKHRPVGLGVQGLADVFYKMRAPFEGDRAREINRNIFETMYYAAVKTSCELAKVEGPYETFEGSPMSQGQFQFDLWGVEPSDRYDWEALRHEVIKYGIRNSTLMAVMPTASTAQIMGNTECIEPITSNIYTRRTIAGDFVVVNKYLIEDLIKLGLWNKELKDMIIADNGSIQNIDGIPQEVKNLYKTAWEVKQKSVIQLAADRGPFICQTQSMNLFFEEPTYNVLHSAQFFGWKSGLKTGSYYIRSRPKVQAQQFTIDPKKMRNKKNTVEAEKLMCSLANPEACEMCSG